MPLQVTAICSEYITNLMNLYAVNSNNWCVSHTAPRPVSQSTLLSSC